MYSPAVALVDGENSNCFVIAARCKLLPRGRVINIKN